MNHRKNWITYPDAQSLVRPMGLKTSIEYKSWIYNNKESINLPSSPDRAYKNRGWTNWFDFLGITKEAHRTMWNTNERTYFIDENYFEKWSHNMAYIVGLWWADGCMNSKYRVSIVLHGNDKYLLEKIQKEIRHNKPLRRYSPVNAYILDITSSKIVKDIISIGGRPRKSKDMNMPIGLPPEFVPDFIRGLWDGDGGMWTSGQSSHGEISSGDKIFLQNVASLLKQNIVGISLLIVDKKSHKNNTNYLNYGLRLSTNNLRKLRDFMYANNPEFKMIRKYNLMAELGPVKKGIYNFEECRIIARRLNITTAKMWQEYIAQNPLCRMPVRPDRAYKNKGWTNWQDWLGK